MTPESPPSLAAHQPESWVALLGWPAGHSISPAMHSAAFAECGLPWSYRAIAVPPNQLPTALRGARALGLKGFNLTLPHKIGALAHLDAIDSSSEASGACNTVVVDGDRLVGYDTDGRGFVESLAAAVGDEIHGIRVGILGAGGSATAVGAGLARAGAEVLWIAARRSEAAAALADRVARHGTRTPSPIDFRDSGRDAVDVVVHCTPVGMAQAPGSAEFLRAQRTAEAWLTSWKQPEPALGVDLIYTPETTPFMAAAAQLGSRTAGGLEMLVRQGAYAFQLWSGQSAPVNAMRRAARAQLARRRAASSRP